MPSASSLSQLLGDLSASAKTGKKGQALQADAILGQTDIFASLLNGLATTKTPQLGAILGTTATGKKTATATLDLASLQLTPELAAALKNLKPEDFQQLPPELAQALQIHMTPQGTLDEKTLGILDALSTGTGTDTGQADLTTLITDPKLADALAGLSAKLTILKQGGTLTEQPAATAPSFAGMLQNQPAATPIATPTAPANDDGRVTVTIADLNGDGFTALKKLAFADIAPYISAPRTVRVDSNTVMKMPQGPSFLDDGMNVASMLTTGTTLAPVFSASADATAQSTPAQTNAPAGPQSVLFNRGQVMAALLGVAQEQQAQTQAKANGITVTTTPGKTQNTIETQVTVAAPVQPVANPALMAAHIAATVAATAPQVTITVSRVFGDVLKGLDIAGKPFDADGTGLDALGAGLQFRADQSQPLATTSTLLTARGATAPHPATYMVSAALQRNLEGVTPGGDRQFTIQLDPANLGRVKITLEFGENNSVKAKLIAERPETVSLLQKDASALERSLQDSGFNVSADGMSFNLGDNGSFQGSMSQNGNSFQNGSNTGSEEDGTELATVETVMPIFVDPETGLTHVNVVI